MPHDAVTSTQTERLLSELGVGESGAIVRVNVPGRGRRRLLELGLVAGEIVRLERIAPLGDPLALCVKGYQLSLRRAEAGQILVRPIV